MPHGKANFSSRQRRPAGCDPSQHNPPQPSPILPPTNRKRFAYSRIEGISVRDVMERDPVAIPEGASIEQALDEYFLRYRSPWFPVVDAAHHFVGLVDRGAADNVPAVDRTSSIVSDVLARDSGSLTVPETAPLESVLGNESLRRLGALIATDSEGRIRGLLTIEDIGKALRPQTPGAPGPT